MNIKVQEPTFEVVNHANNSKISLDEEDATVLEGSENAVIITIPIIENYKEVALLDAPVKMPIH